MKLLLAALVAAAVFALLLVVDVPRPILRMAVALTHGRSERSGPARGLALRLVADGTPFMVTLAKHVREDAAAAAAGVRPEVEAWGVPGSSGRDRTDAFLTGPDRQTLARVTDEAAAADPSCRPPDGLALGYQRLHDGRWRTYLLHTETVITGASVTDAYAATDPDVPGPFAIASVDAEGRDRLADVTGANVGRKLAIVFDDEIRSAPVITGAITAGRIQINPGSGAPEAMKAEAYELVNTLRAGALPGREIAGQASPMLARGGCALAAGLLALLAAWGVGKLRARRVSPPSTGRGA